MAFLQDSQALWPQLEERAHAQHTHLPIMKAEGQKFQISTFSCFPLVSKMHKLAKLWDDYQFQLRFFLLLQDFRTFGNEGFFCKSKLLSILDNQTFTVLLKINCIFFIVTGFQMLVWTKFGKILSK